MNILIIGAGKIGSPIGSAISQAGHKATFCLREGKIPSNDSSLNYCYPKDIQQHSLHAIVLACEPHFYLNDNSFQQLVTQLNLLTTSIPILSVAGGINSKNLAQLFPQRPVTRFFCSSAIVIQDSIRFYSEAGNPEAISMLKQILPSNSWQGVPDSKFNHYGSLLVNSALLCALIHNMEQEVGSLSDDERLFLFSTLGEAGKMIKVNGNSAKAAYQSAATPGGWTEGLCKKMLEQQP